MRAHAALSTPDGQTLSIDVARLGPAGARKSLLVISGTHGLEGAAGSAAQVSWLQATADQTLPDGVNVLLIHALNPYGYAYATRTTEHNVDLNRNFVDHGVVYPDNPYYAQLHPHLILEQWTANALSSSANAIEAFRGIHGADVLFNTTASGQYTHADGVSYGGSQAEWSNVMLQDILAEHLAHTRQVALIDWHTGIGEYGEPFFLCFNDDASEEQHQAIRWRGDKVRHTSSRPRRQWRPRRRVDLAHGFPVSRQGRISRVSTKDTTVSSSSLNTRAA